MEYTTHARTNVKHTVELSDTEIELAIRDYIRSQRKCVLPDYIDLDWRVCGDTVLSVTTSWNEVTFDEESKQG